MNNQVRYCPICGSVLQKTVTTINNIVRESYWCIKCQDYTVYSNTVTNNTSTTPKTSRLSAYSTSDGGTKIWKRRL